MRDPIHTNLQKHLAGARAFTELPEPDQQAIAALPHRARTALFRMWEPTPLQLVTASATPLMALVTAVHALRPDVAAQVRAGVDEARVTFSRSAQHQVAVGGFDRFGHRLDGGAWDPFAAAEKIADALPVEVTR